MKIWNFSDRFSRFFEDKPFSVNRSLKTHFLAFFLLWLTILTIVYYSILFKLSKLQYISIKSNFVKFWVNFPLEPLTSLNNWYRHHNNIKFRMQFSIMKSLTSLKNNLRNEHWIFMSNNWRLIPLMDIWNIIYTTCIKYSLVD